MSQRTLAIIKPDAVKQRVAGEIIGRIEKAGFRISAAKFVHLTKKEAEGFYAVHEKQSWFGELTDFMSSGPCIPMVLEGEEIIKRWRDLMGKTNPEEAAAGTIRKDLGTNIQCNVVHGSDALQTAAFEIGYFFNALETV